MVRFKDGRTIMIEIKHSSDLKEPVPRSRKTPKYISECITWQNNQDKWKYAREYCAERNWEFRVMSEKNLPKGMY
ncbi:head completion protein [Caulobacter phage Cr30]|uniref:head completion protein n=1 Tax=Caulobacter phage Cr30 TaxID=1357714 RepID=UPI0004A9B628|nr:head completion protein [Caulobacter phage Cr30]AGS81117.1 head completion protein [Caulobacter phage Cr30]